MKQKLLIAFAAFLLGSAQFTFATIRTVSNNYNSPGMYTDIQPAINASANGDTIYIHASSTQYGNSYTINKQLTIFGAGYNGKPYQFSNLNVYVYQIILGKNGTISTASGTKIEGLKIEYFSVNVDTIFNVVLERNYFTTGIYTSNSGNLGANSNWVISNNLFSGQLIASSRNNIIANNFINTITSEGANLFDNNIIMGNYGTTPFGTMVNTVFNNNIVYNYNATAVALINANQTGNTFSNNITVNFTSQMPGANNTGLNNIPNTNPDYVLNFASWLGFDSIPSYNWNLQPASPGHNAGTDGTDIGVYGGPFPFANLYGLTQLPQIPLMNIINSTVPLNGNLNVNVEGIKQN